MAYTLPDLPYDYDALEPHVDEQTMRIHHDRHHQGYVTKVNDAIKGNADLENKPIDQLLREIDRVPENIRGAVRNNGGGHANHSLFWSIMSPNGGGRPDGALAEAIDKAFGSLDAFKEKFGNAAATQFGSGWGWLVVDGSGGLKVYSTPNQDSPYMQGDTPILGLDVWEHAYYLKYQNKRADYIDQWWNVVDWKAVAQNYEKARG